MDSVIVHNPVRGYHHDHPAAEENFLRDKRRELLKHLSAVMGAADRMQQAPTFYGDRRLLWQEWDDGHRREGRWLTELVRESN